MKRLFLISMLVCLCIVDVAAQGTKRTAGFETKDRFMPTSRRVDRQIDGNVFAYKGEWALGLTASYGTLSSDNSDIFALLEHVNLSGSMTTISPYVGYFYKNNACVGLRFGYTYMGGTLDNLDVNLGSQNDVGLSVPWVDAASNSFKASVFLRNYTSIDQAGRFGVFSEIEASCAFGGNTMAFQSGDAPMKYNDSKSTTVKLWFNPGVAVYMFPNVCATVSFGMGGFKYTTVKQYDQDGNPTGERDISKLRFRLNLTDIHFGMNIHLWAKKYNK